MGDKAWKKGGRTRRRAKRRLRTPTPWDAGMPDRCYSGYAGPFQNSVVVGDFAAGAAAARAVPTSDMWDLVLRTQDQSWMDRRWKGFVYAELLPVGRSLPRTKYGGDAVPHRGPGWGGRNMNWTTLCSREIHLRETSDLLFQACASAYRSSNMRIILDGKLVTTQCPPFASTNRVNMADHWHRGTGHWNPALWGYQSAVSAATRSGGGGTSRSRCRGTTTATSTTRR